MCRQNVLEILTRLKMHEFHLRCAQTQACFVFTFFLLAFLPLGAKGEDTLELIKKRGVLKWGADAEGGAPYVFPDRQDPNQLTGFEYDLADALAAKLGVKA